MTTVQLLHYVFECAISDREALVDAYQGEGEWAEEARKDVRAFTNLRRKIMLKSQHPVGPSRLRAAIAGICNEEFEKLKETANQPQL